MSFISVAPDQQGVAFKAHFHSRKISTDRVFSENIIVKSLIFSIFSTKNLCRPIIFYKIFFPRKIFLKGNGPLPDLWEERFGNDRFMILGKSHDYTNAEGFCRWKFRFVHLDQTGNSCEKCNYRPSDKNRVLPEGL